jgi:hypothetical protein
MAWFMPVMAVVGAAMSAYQMYQSGKAQEGAAKRQEEMAAEGRAISEKNAQREEAETMEKVRRQGEQQKQEEAQSRAAAAASGFAYDENSGDSIALSLASQQKENRTQLGWERSAGASRADIIRRQGGYQAMSGAAQADAMRSGAKSSMWGAAGQGLKAAGSAYDWWSKP